MAAKGSFVMENRGRGDVTAGDTSRGSAMCSEKSKIKKAGIG